MTFQGMLQAAFVLYFGLLSWQLLTPVTILSAGEWDKLIHFSGFFVLAVLAVLAWKNLSQASLVSLLLVYALSTEILQHFIPGRNFSMLDVLADALGILFALLLYRRLYRFPAFKSLLR